jgi:Tol biopolymer transport system component
MTLRADTPSLLKAFGPPLQARPYNPFSPDGRWIAAVSLQGDVRTWPVNPLDVAQGSTPRELTEDEKAFYDVRPDAEPPGSAD